MKEKRKAGVVFRIGDITENTANGTQTWPLVSKKIGAEDLCNGITYFDPGAGIPSHFHNCEESVLILEGEAIIEIEGVEHHLNASDCVWIPSNAHHRIWNPSVQMRMAVFWTYASAHANRTIVETGQTYVIGE